MNKYTEITENFTLKDLPNLDTCVLAALELFSRERVPKMKIPYKLPLVVGSGNAAVTGKILFADKIALFADETSYERKLQKIKQIDGVVLISASGSKDAPVIAKISKKHKKHITLITNTSHSEAGQYLDMQHGYDQYVFPKNREPYSYNISTYLGMILEKTKENPQKILEFIERRIKRLDYPQFKKYKRYYLIVPDEFREITPLLHRKFSELFGRNIARDIETVSEIKHGTTIVPAKDELLISFGQRHPQLLSHSFLVPLPANADYAAMMAIAYYIIGRIQQKHPAWFKKNIVAYTKKAARFFNQEITPIVGFSHS